MNLVNLNKDSFKNDIKNGINLKIGPFCLNMTSSIPEVVANIYHLYSEHEILDNNEFVDFYIDINTPSSIRKWLRPQALFTVDGHQPIEPLPLEHAYPLFEWGMNWCIANRAHQYLIFHAAIVEKNGKAILLPGEPGAGKSTFCTALAHSGWSLMSDELALLSLSDGKVHPIPKPISLKNESINVVSELFPNADFGKTFFNTSKGTISHLKAPTTSQSNAKIQWIIFPKYQTNANTQLTNKNKGETYASLLNNAFNHNLFGKACFDRLNHILENSDTFQLTYSNTIEAVNEINKITANESSQ